MLRQYVGHRSWVDYSFDLVLGLPCEKIASPRDQTFLPDYLAKYFDCAIKDENPLVLRKESLTKFPVQKINKYISPLYVNLIILTCFLFIGIFEKWRHVHFYYLDFVLFFITGLLGIFFLSLWLFTSHNSVRENLNLLWLIPSHAIVIFVLICKKKPGWLKFYFIETCILMVMLLISWNWLPQKYNIAVMPLLALISFRSAVIVSHLKSSLKIDTKT